MKSINKVFLILFVGILLYPASFAFADTQTITSTLANANDSFSFVTQANSNIGSFNFSGTGTITSISFNFIGTTDSSILTNLDLFENQTKITNGGIFDSNNTITFNNLLISVDGVTTIELRSDLNLSDGDIGKLIQVSLFAITLDQTADPISTQVDSGLISIYPAYYCFQGSYSPLTGQLCTKANGPTITSPVSGNFTPNITNIVTGTCGAQNRLNKVGIHIHNFYTTNEYTTTCDQNGNFQLELSNSDYASMSQMGISYLRAYFTYDHNSVSNTVVIKDPLYPEQPTLDTVSPDTGDQTNDFVTSSQNLVFSGTADAGTEMEMHFEDAHDNGPSTYNTEFNHINMTSITDSFGKWTIDFKSKTIPYGNYYISVFSSNSSASYGSEYRYLRIEAPKLIKQDLNPPVITSPANGFYGGKIETLDFIGTCDYGNTVKIASLDPKMLSPYNRLLSNTYEAPCQSNNTFLIKIESDLVDQNNNVISLPLEVFAIQFDGKGNVSKASTGVNISSTETMPTISTLLPYKGDYQRSPSDIINFFGTSTPNTNIRVTIDNSCPNLTPGTSCALRTVGETISDSNGNWSLKTDSIIDGIWEFNAIEYNNIGSIMSGKLIVVVQKLEAPIILSPISGPYPGNLNFLISGTCDISTSWISFSITALDGSVVFTGGVHANCNPDGTFMTEPLSLDSYTDSSFPIIIHANQFDAAGNTSPDSNVITLTAPVITPPSGGGGGGGGGNPPVCSRVMGDINCDEKVDKYDFSLMMMVWGYKTKDNADLNTDLSIDKYDFALLMTNWGYGVKGSGMAIIKH